MAHFRSQASRLFRMRSIRTAAVSPILSPTVATNAIIGPASTLQARHASSFMRRVLDQVAKDLENSKEFQKAKKDFKDQGGEESAENLRKKAKVQEEKLKALKEKVSTQTTGAKESTSNYLKAMRESAKERKKQLDEEMEKKVAEDEALKEKMRKISEMGQKLGGNVKSAFGATLEKLKAGVTKFEGEKAESHKKWKAGKEGMKAWKEEKAKTDAMKAETGPEEAASETAAENIDSKAADGAEKTKSKEASTEPETKAEEQNALVLKHESTWDRFGASMRDMPLLHGVLENPLFDRLFSETEIAQSIREMKEQVPTFRMVEMQEEVEYVIAPAVVRAYLEGNQDFLRIHCGEAAFRVVNASIEERHKAKLELDQDLRVPPNEITLAGAKCVDVGGGYHSPVFVFTFHTQQINCLTKISDGEVVEGAVDDLRNVYYALAITRHPLCDPESREEYIHELRKQKAKDGQGSVKKAESEKSVSEKAAEAAAAKKAEAENEFADLDETSLEFPWLISELAIVGNQTVW